MSDSGNVAEKGVGARAVEQTIELLERFPNSGIQLRREGGMLEIIPSGEHTFPITVFDQGDEAMISAERWHTHYDDPEQVAFCAYWLLTPFYRIVHELKGGVQVAVWLDVYDVDGWQGCEPVYFMNPEHAKSWEPLPGESYHRRFVQQAVLPPFRPYAELCPGAELDEDGLPPDFQPGKRVVEGTSSVGVTLHEAGDDVHVDD